MKKYVVALLLMMNVILLGMGQKAVVPRPYSYARPIGPQLFSAPSRKAMSPSLMQKQERERLVQKFEAMTRGGNVAFEEAQKIVEMLKSSSDPLSRTEGLNLEKHLMTLRTYKMCHEKVKQTRDQNEQLKKQLAQAQKKGPKESISAPSVQKIKELEEKIIEVQKKEQDQAELVIKMTENAPQLLKLTNLKKRAEIEFGSSVVKKMIDQKELALSDFIDKNARFLSIMGLHVKDGRLTSRTMEGGEETTPEWELAQAKLSIAQLTQDNEACKKQIAKLEKKKEEALRQEGKGEQSEDLAAIRAENKELRAQVKKLKSETLVATAHEPGEQQEITKEHTDLSEKLQSANAEINALKKLQDAAHEILKDCFGDGFADAVTLGVNHNLLDTIDYKKPFIQELCTIIQRREK